MRIGRTLPSILRRCIELKTRDPKFVPAGWISDLLFVCKNAKKRTRAEPHKQEFVVLQPYHAERLLKVSDIVTMKSSVSVTTGFKQLPVHEINRESGAFHN